MGEGGRKLSSHQVLIPKKGRTIYLGCILPVPRDKQEGKGKLQTTALQPQLQEPMN